MCFVVRAVQQGDPARGVLALHRLSPDHTHPPLQRLRQQVRTCQKADEKMEGESTTLAQKLPIASSVHGVGTPTTCSACKVVAAMLKAG